MRIRVVAYLLVGLIILGSGLVYLRNTRPDIFSIPGVWESNTETVEVTEYHPPNAGAVDDLVDDQLSNKNPTFIPDLIDRRPEGGWRINASSAVLRLDVPMLKPDADVHFSSCGLPTPTRWRRHPPG